MPDLQWTQKTCASHIPNCSLANPLAGSEEAGNLRYELLVALMLPSYFLGPYLWPEAWGQTLPLQLFAHRGQQLCLSRSAKEARHSTSGSVAWQVWLGWLGVVKGGQFNS